MLIERSAPSPSDEAVLRESRERPERFAELFDAYHREIYGYVASRLSAGHADDLAAETFLVAFRSRARFGGGGGHVRAWLYGIATNLIRRHHRDEERKYRALGRADAADRARAGDQDDDNRIVARVAARGVQRDLAVALRSLKRGDRDVLLLVALAELSYPEVAEALGIPEGRSRRVLAVPARPFAPHWAGSTPPLRAQEQTIQEHLMDDFHLIREILNAPPPSVRATVQARARLSAAIEARQPAGRSRRWVLGSAGALAGIAVLALVVTLLDGPTDRGTQTPELSARDILLAAANHAASEVETGRYWHVQKVIVSGPFKVGKAPDQYSIVDRAVDEQWIARDPAEGSWAGRRDLGSRPRSEADQQAWRKAGSPAQWDLATDTSTGSVRRSAAPGKGELLRLDTSTYLYDLGGFDRSQVQGLPTDPEKLRDLFVARIAASRGGFAPGTRGSDSRLVGAMCQLLVDVPAPSAVRAAAFTVLASVAGMRSIGEVKDDEGRTGIGIELVQTFPEISDSRQLIVDPATHLILASNYSANLTGEDGTHPIKEQRQVILKAEWTDEQPKAPTIS